jgi:hypothetical protein
LGSDPGDLDRPLRYAPGSFSPLGGSPFFVSVLDHGVFALLASLLDLLAFAGAVTAVLLARGRWTLGPGPGEVPGRAVGCLAASWQPSVVVHQLLGRLL